MPLATFVNRTEPTTIPISTVTRKANTKYV
jgi:hypothetical protein